MFGKKSDEEEIKDLMNKIFSMDKKKRRAVERMIDVISDRPCLWGRISSGIPGQSKAGI